MEFVVTDKGKHFIDGINKDLEAGENIPLLVPEKDRNYFINFTCTDVAKANLFAYTLMYNRNIDLEEVLGIRVNSFNYCQGDSKVGELKDYLRAFLDRLDRM